MSDFDLQRRLRELDTPRAPREDLWSAIETRIAAEARPVARRHRFAWPLAAAAGLLLAVAASTLVIGTRHAAAPVDVADAGTSLQQRLAPRVTDRLSRAPGGDPRLLGAAVVLDSAHAELQQALEQRPDAVFLVSLLNRTNARRMKLDHFGSNAG